MQLTLAAARTNAGLTQTDAAKEIGVTVATIVSWESRKTYPSVKYLKAIEKAYGCTYADIKFSDY